jgi:hypothetical protein
MEQEVKASVKKLNQKMEFSTIPLKEAQYGMSEGSSFPTTSGSPPFSNVWTIEDIWTKLLS